MEGNEVRAARKALGMTQVEFAALVGVHPITVSKWERSVAPVMPTTANLVALLLKTHRGKGKR